MNNKVIDHLVAAAHTPFHEDGSLAPEVVEQQAHFLAGQGIKTVFITGSTGESSSLSRDEKVRIFEAWSEWGPAAGLEVIAHVGSNCLVDACYLAQVAAGLPFRAFSALSPSYYKPASVEMLVACCEKVAAAAPELPFYYYDIPVLTGVEFDMEEFLKKASGRIPNLAGIKFTNQDLESFTRARKVGAFDLPWGIDEKFLEALKVGAKGAVGSTYNFAASLYFKLTEHFEKGEIDAAQALQDKSIAIIEALASVGYLGAAKALMSWRGVPMGPARLPLGNPSSEQLARLRDQLAEFDEFLK